MSNTQNSYLFEHSEHLIQYYYVKRILTVIINVQYTKFVFKIIFPIVTDQLYNRPTDKPFVLDFHFLKCAIYPDRYAAN
jgi:hypothetical protein